MTTDSVEGGPLQTSTATTADGQGDIPVGRAHFCPLGTVKNRKAMILTYHDLRKEV